MNRKITLFSFFAKTRDEFPLKKRLFRRICGRSESKLQLKLIVTIYKLKSSNAFPMIRNDDFFSLSNRVEGNQSLILADRGGNPRS